MRRRIESLDEVKRLLCAGKTLLTPMNSPVRMVSGTPLYEENGHVSAATLLACVWAIDEPDPAPKTPAPPAGVTNAVVCEAHWSKGKNRFSFVHPSRSYVPLHEAISYGATHFGFEREDRTVFWLADIDRPWRWREDDVFYSCPSHVRVKENATQVPVTWVCLSTPESE